ncbi:MAG TPA: oxidoreductase [Candidatus Levybacteria bacterium]|nr:oxidoreductase [Candidatus Levybacteria bacterium]
MPLVRPIDTFLNAITMYRLVLYGLIGLSGIAILFGFLGILPFNGIQLLISLSIVSAVGYITKKIFAKLFKAQTNYESSVITSLILFLIVAPVNSIEDAIISSGISAIAIASKYFFAIDKKHIFNPAAIAVFLAGLLGFGNGIWWIGSVVMLPFVVIVGLLIVRKIRRFHLLFAFILTAIPTIILFNLKNGVSPQDSFIQVFASWPIIFFGTVMLTEPLTMPARKKLYIPFGMLVGVLFGSQFHIGPLFSSPELALVVGNIYGYIVGPKYKLFLHLKERIQIAPNIYEFIFTKSGKFNFLPGQYLEWTLPEKSADSRGNRRYFTIASSPTNENVVLGVRIDTQRSSKFKRTLLDMQAGDAIVASQLSGDFVLPHDQKNEVVFIAGGIGITPFRSMVEYLLDTGEKRNVVMFYTASHKEEFVYMDIFKKAQDMGWLTMVYVITKEENAPSDWAGEKGHLTEEILKKYQSADGVETYYISGPNAMVEAYKHLLHSMKVQHKRIVTDYFPGF